MNLKTKDLFLLFLVYYQWQVSMAGQSNLQILTSSLVFLDSSRQSFQQKVTSRLESMTRYITSATINDIMTINTSFPTTTDVFSTTTSASSIVYTTIHTPHVSSINLMRAEAKLLSTNVSQENIIQTPFPTATNFNLQILNSSTLQFTRRSTSKSLHNTSTANTINWQRLAINSTLISSPTYISSTKSIKENKTSLPSHTVSENIYLNFSSTQGANFHLGFLEKSIFSTHSTNQSSIYKVKESPIYSNSFRKSLSSSSTLERNASLLLLQRSTSMLQELNGLKKFYHTASLMSFTQTSKSAATSPIPHINTFVVTSSIPHIILSSTYGSSVRHTSKNPNQFLKTLLKYGVFSTRTKVSVVVEASVSERKTNRNIRTVSRFKPERTPVRVLAISSSSAAAHTSSSLLASQTPTIKTEVRIPHKKSEGFPAWIAILSSAGALTAIITIVAVTFKFVRWNKDHGDYALWVSNLELQPITSRNAEVLT
ncbi:uncharacterized protein LOC135691771 [Rhopilema esculentum]|uniref:uncharacterized protein LOC135691771 n=1 Tax=Rhopilema esculentum TaxID=499914 RepID=UPI0031D9FC7A